MTPTIVFEQPMKWSINAESPLTVIFDVGVLLRGSVPDASIRSGPIAPTGRHRWSHTVNRKSVSTRERASVRSRAVVAIVAGLPDASAERQAANCAW